jgi:hypothetical protein
MFFPVDHPDHGAAHSLAVHRVEAGGEGQKNQETPEKNLRVVSEVFGVFLGMLLVGWPCAKA